MKINEIEFILLGDKIRTYLKKKEYIDILELLEKKPNKRQVYASPYIQKMYKIIKERIINKYTYKEVKYILVFYSFFTNSNTDLLNDYSIVDTIIKNFNSFSNYKLNMNEYFIIEFFDRYKIENKDMKCFLKDNIYEYGLLRDLMDNKISLILFLLLDEMFGFSVYMNKQDIVYWKKYSNKVSNIKKFFKIDRRKTGFKILYNKLKIKLEIEYKINLDKSLIKNRIFIKEN